MSTLTEHQIGPIVYPCAHDRDMTEWFAGRIDFLPPDERTVRRKVSAIWKAQVSS